MFQESALTTFDCGDQQPQPFEYSSRQEWYTQGDPYD